MFATIRQFHVLTKLVPYVHPADEGYIGADSNWEYLNKFIQPCYAPTWSQATTEACNWTPLTPTQASDFHWAGYRSSSQTGSMEN
eukprot:CAMPEP_0181290212 /NCGR_PEP_ID=MMETSP1101-20121128/1296_1 /TAXON_ID=46948 /ORGANISM="Rhodomonas abbreviata, Strain Caron Lab Isolate" /LENGTH=84 /DNA_ID=CAMNT_0023394487 /DNA_START=144 /DNA_END=398 /DNA_ORIENTATION=-